jgi:hypothetical protein
MNKLAFDTHAYVKQLIDAGFSEQQAEAQAELLGAFVESSFISKHDLKALESRLTSGLREETETVLKQERELLLAGLRGDLERLQAEISEIRQRTAELKARLLWLVVLQASIVIALLI